jgi:hypothetical protein
MLKDWLDIVITSWLGCFILASLLADPLRERIARGWWPWKWPFTAGGSLDRTNVPVEDG